MHIISHDPYLSVSTKASGDLEVEFVGREALCSRSDVLSIHVPLTRETHHAIGARELSWMKPTALIINTARGPIIDQNALFKALQNKEIAGAGLDVFEQEPVSGNNPLLGLDNIILTPHSAALTRECVIRMAVEAAHCVLAVFDNRVPPNVANPQVLASEKWKQLKPAEGQ